MHSLRNALLACSLSASISLPASAAEPAPPGWDQLTGAGIARHVEKLASDEFLGRGPAGPGEPITLDYLTAQFRAAGLQPAFGVSYLQPIALIESTPTEATALRLGKTTLSFAREFVALSFAPDGKAELDKSELIFGGYGIVAPEQQWDDYAGVDIRGKTVLLLAGEPGEPTDDALFDGRALTVHGMRDSKLETAAARGAAAVLFIHTEAGFGYAWGAIESGAKVPRSALQQGEDARRRLLLSGTISEPAARRALKLAGHDADALIRSAASRGFRAQALSMPVSLALQSRIRATTTYNVVGVLRGTGAADEAVLYTAHWDHLGENPQLPGEDHIFNGAVDNATGTAALIEIARVFASGENKPRRSLVFIATGAEEQGLLGADHYAQNPLFPLDRTVAVINMDALFPFGRTASMTVTGMHTNELEHLLRDAARRVGRSLLADPSPEFGAYFRSDHYPFVKRGVPGLFAVGGLTLEQFEAGGDLVAPWNEYMTRYHQPNDHYDAARWDMGGIEQDARTFFEIGYRLAYGRQWPNWTWNHAFRALRDRQLHGD